MTNERCKIDLVTDRYDLDSFEVRYDSVDEHLLARWTGSDGREPDGYRTLTDWFNKRLMQAVYEANGRDTLGKRIESDYEALVSSDDLLREEVRDDLQLEGIDPDRLQREMVSWSTVRSHLTTCLDGEKPIERSESNWERESVNVAADITEGKVREALSSLSSRNRLPEGERADVTVQVLLGCPECPTRIPFADALERGYVCKDHFPVAETREEPKTEGD